MLLRVLFVGDIVGKSGRTAFLEQLSALKMQWKYDLLIVNGENSAHGKGITERIYNEFIQAGTDCVTLGNHAFSKDNIYSFIDKADCLIRPANMLPENVGKSAKIIEKNGYRIGVYNVYGNIFMEQTNGDPYTAMNQLLQQYPSDIRIVDFHAEATSEKYLFLNCFSKQVQMIVGTHTHIQTADECIRDKCAFICDVGMTGPYQSILGRDIDEVYRKTVLHQDTRFTVSDNPAMLCAVVVDIDLQLGQAVSIKRIQLRPQLGNTEEV